jgi:O-acetyl-ADP-ribose deacetylase (regulator of RNase III)
MSVATSDQKTINQTSVKLFIDDITLLEVDAWVYYAQHDLKLGSGFGTAVTLRGGPEVQKELDKLEPIKTCETAVSGTGNLKAKHIIHAAGPRFQEEDMEGKLHKTMQNVLARADELGAKTLAFPAMGVGFYGVALDLCASVMLKSIKEHLQGSTGISEVILCVLDNRELKPFQAEFAAFA